jgi:hypothetical protein
LIAGGEFICFFDLNSGILLNGHKIYTGTELKKTYDGTVKANYIQVKKAIENM